jgi:SsrA-binding protein
MAEEHRERTVKQIAQNRKALHDFFVSERIEVGIALEGTEVKSIRDGKVNLQDSYAVFKPKDGHELWLVGMHVSPYHQGSYNNHDPRRNRKLLLKKQELQKIKQKTLAKGVTLVPLSIYLSGHLVKIELGLMKGKKQFDKRETIKERDTKRTLQRLKKMM